MERRNHLTHLILASVIASVLIPLMVCADAQAQIAFVSSRDGHIRDDIPIPALEIYVMDADGGNQRRLTNNPASDHSPAWSPYGKHIAFVSYRAGHVDAQGFTTSDIYVMDADGSNPQNLTNDPSDDRQPSWSPDGKRIVFSSDRDADRDNPHNIEIYVMNADGGNPQRLTENLIEDKYPSWSPDGERIVFSARREGHVENKFGITYEIYVMDADGGNEQRLTENRNNDWDPVWSPDGNRIAFESDRKGDFVNFDIYVMDADGGNLQKLTNNRAWNGGPSWSPSGERIAFWSNKEDKFKADIYVMDADGGNLQNLTNNRHSDASPAWLNSPFSVAPAGKQFVVWGSLKQRDR